MASRPFKSKILHKETLQNANQEVEVIIRTKPKFSHSDKPKAKPFVRNCHLKKALDKISEESGEQIPSPSSAKKTLGYQTKKAPRTTVEISKRKLKKNTTSNAADETWADVLSKYSCENNEDEVDERITNKRSHREKSAKLNRLEATSRSKYESNIHDHRKINVNLQNFEHNRRTIESHTAKEINPTEQIKPRANDNLPNAQTLINQQTNGTNKQQENAETPQNQVQDGRLYSDGISNTPFSDSALKLLEQLKVKLAKRGDDGSNEVLGLIEHCLSVGHQTPMSQLQLNNAHSSVFGNSFNNTNLNDDARAQQVKNSNYDHEKRIAELEAENARQCVIISELRILGARMLSQMKQPNDAAPKSSKKIQTNSPNIEKLNYNSTCTRDEVSKGPSNSSNKENELNGEEGTAAINNTNPLSKYGNTADYEKKELRVALLRSQVDNELLRKQLNNLQLSQQNRSSAKPPIQSNRNNEVDSAFSSKFPSKQPSPAHTSGQHSATPPQVVISEDIPENVGAFIGTASTNIDVAMFAETNENDRLRMQESIPHQNSLTIIPTLLQQEKKSDQAPVRTQNNVFDASVQSYVLHSHYGYPEDSTKSSLADTDHSNTSSRSEVDKHPVKMVRSYEDRVPTHLSTNDLMRYSGTRNRPQFSLNSSSINDATPNNNNGARLGFSNSSVESSNIEVYESTRMNNGSELTVLPVEEDSCSIPS